MSVRRRGWRIVRRIPGVTRRIHYTKSDDQAVTGYFATTYVDDLEDTRCALYISSVFDISNPAGHTTAAARYEAVYMAMFAQIRRTMSALADQPRPDAAMPAHRRTAAASGAGTASHRRR